jgi:hypothetical protein
MFVIEEPDVEITIRTLTFDSEPHHNSSFLIFYFGFGKNFSDVVASHPGIRCMDRAPLLCDASGVRSISAVP